MAADREPEPARALAGGSPSKLPECGDTVGAYTLLRSLGGHVFEAAGQTGERLAWKAIPSLAIDESGSHEAHAAREAKRARFLDDLARVTGLHHPNLASVLDGDLDTAYGWVVWPLFEGDSLASRRRGGQVFTEQEVEAITSAVSAAAAALHAAGLGHGGITPNNVLLVDDGGRDRVILAESGSFPGGDDAPSDERTSRHTDDRATTRGVLFGVGAAPVELVASAPPAASSGPTSIFELAPSSRKRPITPPPEPDLARSSPTIAPSGRPSHRAEPTPKPSTTAPSATSERRPGKELDEPAYTADRRVVVGLGVALGVALLALLWRHQTPPAPHGSSPVVASAESGPLTTTAHPSASASVSASAPIPPASAPGR